MSSAPAAADRVARLGRWYDRDARDLPWRRTRDPYAIWVSEIMLQQTRVDTVIPYYERFLARFPAVAALASAPLDEVLRLWSGLGYYRRARQLHAAAISVMAEHGGKIPSTAAGLRQLAGIGRYTAGAIASIAFGERAALVDGNVARVLARVDGIAEDVRSSRGSKIMWQRAEAMVPADRPGRFNQALMELGATICTPTSPRCDSCPWARDCEAKRSERTAELPVMGEKKAPRELRLAATVIAHRASGTVLLAQRPAEGLFAGLWEAPMAARLADLGDLGDDVALVGEVVHVLTHRRLAISVHVGEARQRRRRRVRGDYVAMAWHAPEAVALSTMARKVLAMAEAQP